MIVRLLIAIAAIYFAIQLIRYFRRLSPEARKKFAVQYGAWIVLVVTILLFATGRLHWIGAAIGASLPFLARIIHWLPRIMPLVGMLGRSGFANSLLKTPHIQLTINPSNGQISGKILSGEHQGAELQSLSESELNSLLEKFKAEHQPSARLLSAYMRLRFQQAGDNQEATSNQSTSTIANRTEALEILGLEEGASEQDIITAHKRLIQKLHPDRGGSDYLAAMINQAKDFLLKT